MSRPWLVCALLLAACGESPVDPAAARHTIVPLGDTILYARPGSSLAEPLGVFASVDGAPLPGLVVEWSVAAGSVVLGASYSHTGSDGAATMTASAGERGTARVRATTSRLQRSGVTFTIHVIDPPTVLSVVPSGALPGGIVTISGTGFGAPGDAIVTFGGVRGQVVSASDDVLEVAVPSCVEAGTVEVIVARGSVSAAPAPFAVLPGASSGRISLLPGESRRLSGASLGCIRLPAIPGAEYLVTTHNTRAIDLPPLYLEWRGRAASPVPAARATFAESWEVKLRSERFGGPDDALSALTATRVPVVGERRSFSVLDAQNRFQTIAATVQWVGARAAFYVDDASPVPFTPTQLSAFAEIFDDPIYDAVTDAFGAPSDIDSNDRVIVLFTPRVNALTPRGETSFIAGFFYSCDLVSRSRCSGSNRGEVFYSMVPDPAAQFGDPRSVDDVVANVPPVLAHEFQHMIHFARRGFTSDELWLSEALAHTAEDLVAERLSDRGDALGGAAFRAPVLRRAQRYLLGPQYTGVVSNASPPTGEQRGAGWLFLRYLRSHYDDGSLLLRLTSSTRTGASNVAAETNQDWATLAADFGVALWSAGDPGAAPLAPLLTFGTYDLGSALRQVAPGFTFEPFELEWTAGTGGGTHMSGSSAHLLLVTPADGTPLSATLTGRRGEPLPLASPAAVTISRIR